MNKSPHSFPNPTESQNTLLSSIRHDVKGLLTPALLMADKLALSKDPDIQKSAQIIITSIEKVTKRLNTL
ncbi:hypothetical protein [Entomobacter blattae]|uniref:Signal transduction histidine kinase dimerisation/phosphoacceptor domain-containing protein n=1 Tax=Entomobacter blattae TaxID=2762277 RepID=A0A7H1NSL8_9PROT|nr:hypothetical protein [Entomobacter blattae]QNT78778.1 hypothetical protein JGUZn3_15550 [Entomobacter blattae]